MSDQQRPAKTARAPLPPLAEADGDPAPRLELMSFLEAHAEAESKAGRWLHLDREVLALVRRILSLKRAENR